MNLARQQLPAETIDHIISYVTYHPALGRLSLASSTLCGIALPFLYKSYGYRDTLDLETLCERIESEIDNPAAAPRPIRERIQEIICTDPRLRSNSNSDVSKYMNPSLTRRLASAVSHMPKLHTFSCLEWVPTNPSLLYPKLRDACPGLRRVEIGLPSMAFDTRDFSEKFQEDTFVFQNLTHFRVTVTGDGGWPDERWYRYGFVPESLVDMLTKCPNLESLSLDLGHEQCKESWELAYLLYVKEDTGTVPWPHLRVLELYSVSDDEGILSAFLESHPSIEELTLTESLAFHTTREPVVSGSGGGCLPNLRVLTGSMRLCNEVLSQLSPSTMIETVCEVATNPDNPVLGADDDDDDDNDYDSYENLDKLMINVARFPTIHSFEMESGIAYTSEWFDELVAALPNLRSLSLHFLRGHAENPADIPASLGKLKHLRKVSVNILLAVVGASGRGDHGPTPSLMQVFEAAAHACPLLSEVDFDPRDSEEMGAVVWRDGHGGVEVRFVERERERPVVEYESEMDSETEAYYGLDGE